MRSVEELCEQLGSGDQPQAYKARQALVQMAAEAGAPANDARRAELASQLAKAEEAKDADAKAFKYSAAVRGQVARALCEVGGDMEVPALKTAVGDFDAREMARWALNRMTCQAATDALIEAALKAVGTEFRVGAVNALATRSASAVLEALKQCAADADPEVRLAAAEALANHTDASLDSIIAPVATAGGPRAESRIARARIRLASRLAKAGQKDAARGIYQAIANANVDDAQKKAAQAGLSQLG